MKVKQNNKHKKKIVIGILVLVGVVAIIAWYMLTRQSFFDPSAVSGQLPGKTEQEIIDELNLVVEEGMFNISINTQLNFDKSDAEGRAYIENIAANKYDMKVKIVLDDTDKTVYQSGGLEPGQYIEMIRLSKKLSDGSYAATAIFTAHDRKSHKEIGRTSAELNITIGTS